MLFGGQSAPAIKLRHIIVLGREYSMISTPPDMSLGPEGLIPGNIEK